MIAVHIDDRVLVGGQPSLSDLATLKASGVKRIINLRVAGEGNQPLSPEAESEEAGKLELSYVHIPVSSASLAETDIAAVKAAIDSADGQVFLHCAAGQRACALGLLAKADEANLTASDIFSEAEARGFAFRDVKVRGFIERIRAEQH